MTSSQKKFFFLLFSLFRFPFYGTFFSPLSLKPTALAGRWLTLVIPALWEDKARRVLKSNVQDQLSNTKRPGLYKKNKIIWPWWYVTVVPATWEAEVGGSLEPRRSML